MTQPTPVFWWTIIIISVILVVGSSIYSKYYKHDYSAKPVIGAVYSNTPKSANSSFCASSEPEVRLNNKFHAGFVYDIDTNEDGTQIISGGFDKTLRTWKWDGGKFKPGTIRRMPIGSPSDGIIMAVSISPDGRYLIAGGQGIEYMGLSIFDQSDDDFVRNVNVEPLISIIASPTRERAICIGFQSTMCIRLPSGDILWKDNKYLSHPAHSCWLPDGRSITVGPDGLRCYDADGVVKHFKYSNWPKPHKIAVSGNRVLVLGLTDSVMLISTDTFDIVEEQNFRDIGGHDVSSILSAHGRWWASMIVKDRWKIVSWSQTTKERNIIDGPEDEPILVMKSMPQGLAVLTATPSIHVIGFDGQVIGTLTDDQNIFKNTRLGKGKGNSALRTDAKGSQLYLEGSSLGGKPIVFDVGNGIVRNIQECPSGFEYQKDCSANIEIKRDDGKFSVSIGGRPVELPGEPGPKSPCAISDRYKMVFIANVLGLTIVDSAGKTEDFVLNKYYTNLACPSDASVLIATGDDGVIDWYNLPKCEKVLSCNIQLDRRQWATWTPNGYYWTSPEGDSIIGWLINPPVHNAELGLRVVGTIKGNPAEKAGLQKGDYITKINGVDVIGMSVAQGTELIKASKGTEILCQLQRSGNTENVRISPIEVDGARRIGVYLEANTLDVGPVRFYPISHLADRYSNPGLVKQVISTWSHDYDIDKSLGKKSSIKDVLSGVPLVRIKNNANMIDLPDGTDSAIVEVEVTDNGGGIDEVRVLINGKALGEIDRGLRSKKVQASSAYQFEIPVVPGNNEVRITAFNTQRTESNPAIVYIRCPERQATSTLFGIAIAIGAYENPRYRLDWTIADAQAVMETLTRSAKPLFGSVQWTPILDAQVSKASVQSAFAAVQAKARPGDTLVVFYAGHGVMSEGTSGVAGSFYLIPPSIRQIYGHDEDLAANAISAYNLRDWCKAVPAQKQILLLDACESGGAVDLIAMRGASEESALAQLSRSAGISIIAAAGSTQSANEIKALGHGVFTYALLEGLSGKARQGDRPVTVRGLDAWLGQIVPELTKQYRSQMQIPTSSHRGQDFPLTLPSKN